MFEIDEQHVSIKNKYNIVTQIVTRSDCTAGALRMYLTEKCT